MVRSHWNEQAFQELIDVASQWDDDLAKSYCALARDRLSTTTSGKTLTPMKQDRLERLRGEQPEPNHAMEWNTTDMAANFSQEGERLWFRYPQGYVYWDMPKGFDLSSTHEALLWLAAETLLYPWEPSTRAHFQVHEVSGSEPAFPSRQVRILRLQRLSCPTTPCSATTADRLIRCSTTGTQNALSVI